MSAVAGRLLAIPGAAHGEVGVGQLHLLKDSNIKRY